MAADRSNRSAGAANSVSSNGEIDWLSLARRAASSIRDLLSDRTTTAQRAVETGSIGAGGDRTLTIDADAEALIFAELKGLHAQGVQFSAVSEECGIVEFGEGELRVVIDPIDGSLNAKRGLTHAAVSIAVANGNTIADVFFGYVFDFGAQEEWVAFRDRGAELNGVELPRDLAERRTEDGKLEIVGIESSDPRWLKRSIDDLSILTYRFRAIGTIAVSLCQVAAGRFDGMVSLRNCRAVDAAAAALIVREAGGYVAFPTCTDPLGAPLDVTPHSPVVAARSASALEALANLAQTQTPQSY